MEIEIGVELHILNHRLRILSINKKYIKNFMFEIVKIAFTNKTKCKFFSFIETNDDYSIIVDEFGFNEFLCSIDDSSQIIVSKELWVPMFICGEDLPGAMSISKIAKYIILPLADSTISIMAISTYQCDYILIQEKDYDSVIKCLSSHIPNIYNEKSSHAHENICIKSNYYSNMKSNKLDLSQRSITLPLIIPENTEYCIIGVYNQDTFAIIIPTLIDIMFYETSSYNDEEIFFNLTRRNSDISIVMQTKFVNNFPSDIIRSVENNYWKLIRIGENSLSLEFSGVCAQVSSPLESANIDEYYISSYHTGFCFIPSDKIDTAKDFFLRRGANIIKKSQFKLDLFKSLNKQTQEESFIAETTTSNTFEESTQTTVIEKDYQDEDSSSEAHSTYE